MKKKHLIWLLAAILCALLLLVGIIALVGQDAGAPVDPTTPEQTTAPAHNNQIEPTYTVGVATSPDDQPSVVEIPVESGASLGVQFPCKIPGYDLVIEKMAPYTGMYVEDGTNANVQDVAMLLVSNEGDYPVEYTQISVSFGEENLLFDISALPEGEKLVVQEKTGKSIPAGKITAAKAMVVRRAEMAMSESQVKVTDNGDNTLTIENLTGEAIPTVRVFYKYYAREEGVFIGGIAFTVRIKDLAAGASVTVQPSHYNSQTSRVVMVMTYDSEV